MNDELKKTNSILRIARLAGFLYFLQIPLGVFGLVYPTKALMVPGDIAATISAIAANEFLFRLSIVSAILAALFTFLPPSRCTKYSSQLIRA